MRVKRGYMTQRVKQLAAGSLVGMLAATTSVASSFAQTAPASQPAPELFSQDRSNLFGDMGGLRSALATLGISFNIQEQSEVLGNVSGGVRRGADYDGLTTMNLTVDTAKAFGWDGGTFFMSALQIHGRDLTTDDLRVLNTASSIEADRATRLWELWYQQTIFGGKADVKVGQQSVDQEFIISQFSSLFINSMMGWPALPSNDLYAGGPAYPLSSLGIRLRAHPSDAVTVLAGVFDDNPPGGPFNDDSQVLGREAAGVRFNLATGALFLTEVQYAINQPSSDPHAPPSTRPPRRLQDWRLIRYGRVSRSAFRRYWVVARESPKHRHPANAPRQFQCLRLGRSDCVAT
jgi:porin